MKTIVCRLSDEFARGKLRQYSLVVICTDEHFIPNNYSFFIERLHTIKNKLMVRLGIIRSRMRLLSASRISMCKLADNVR